jgi:hypothetical protein
VLKAARYAALETLRDGRRVEIRAHTGSWPTIMVIRSPGPRVRQLFIASAPYWIKFVHTAKYKIKPHTTAINTNQIAILPNLGTCP